MYAIYGQLANQLVYRSKNVTIVYLLGLFKFQLAFIWQKIRGFIES